jgi:dTDP-4-dehydrorhamnose reductase
MSVTEGNGARAGWLVIGASGLVGGELVRQLRAGGEDVTGAARSVLGEATRVVDLAVRDDVERLVAEVAPSVVVIAAAWPHVDGCEADPARSRRENVDTVKNLLGAAGDGAAAPRVVFYSSDHVFDGRKGAPYVESDAPNPLNVYAAHKREVEELLLARGRSLVVRTAWVFGSEIRKKNFVYRVAELARSGATLKVPVDQAGCPTWSGWLAETTIALVGRDAGGVVHATGTELFSKAEWARVIAGELGLPPVEVEEVDWRAAGQIAPRPARVALASERHSFVHPDVRATLRANRGAFER